MVCKPVNIAVENVDFVPVNKEDLLVEPCSPVPQRMGFV